MENELPKESEIEALRREVELLGRENERLKEQLRPFVATDNPCFDPNLFMRILGRRLTMLLVPTFLIVGVLEMIPAVKPGLIPRSYIGRVAVIDMAGSASGFRGFGLGIVAFGGAAFGVVAVGGLAVGIIAVGGGAVGVIAIGGGAIGVVAIGGGACGYVAIGGVAAGHFAMGQRGRGQYVLGLNRQDPEAISFFTRRMPALRRALTTPMPVIVIKRSTSAGGPPDNKA